MLLYKYRWLDIIAYPYHVSMQISRLSNTIDSGLQPFVTELSTYISRDYTYVHVPLVSLIHIMLLVASYDFMNWIELVYFLLFSWE